MRGKFQYFSFLFILGIAFFLFPSVKAIINVPISDYNVTFDGDVGYSEWSDAHYISLNSFDDGYFDFYLKYDNNYEELQFGFIVDDIDYDEVDRIGFFFDTQNNGGTDTDLDDFILIIFRQTTSIYGFYPYPVDSIYLNGTGSGFFNGNIQFDPSSLPAPFGTFFLERNEINPRIDFVKGGAYGDSWEGEFRIGLSNNYVQGGSDIEIGFGLVYWDFDYNGSYVNERWYPFDVSESPSTWETLVIQQPQPELSVSFVSPSYGTSLEDYPVQLRVGITSNGLPVYDAITNFYVDGSLAGVDYTDTSGYAGYDYYPSEGTHTWYIDVEKTGYLGTISFLQSFTYYEPMVQQFSHQQIVTDEASNFLEGVNVWWDEVYQGMTDNEGSIYIYYYGNIGENHTIELSKTGYETDYMDVTIQWEHQKNTKKLSPVPDPELSVALVSPSSGATITNSSVRLRARVNSDGSPIRDAYVEFYINNNYIAYDYSDISGYVEYTATVDEGSHSWYVKAFKDGYTADTSSVGGFTYTVQRYQLSIDSEVYVFGEGAYEEGESVTLITQDTTENILVLKKFVCWIVDGYRVYDDSLTLTMDSAQTVSVVWESDYTRLYVTGFIGVGLIASGLYVNQRNTRERLAAEERALVDSAFDSARGGLGDKLSSTRIQTPIDLSDFVSEHVSLDDVRNILGDVVAGNSVVGWFLSGDKYLTKTALFNLIEYEVQAKSGDLFDLVSFAETVGVDLSIVRKNVESLLRDEKIKGYLTTDNKLMAQEHLQNTLKKLIK